ncbi:phosphotransferase family protein [Alkalicoccus daliensis]|uniref:Thiamine kinase n=1 Tax=Alkalicoccus daliensis TaxID=745820 RepID=A0A1H0H328_9BACI|nr:phosphotransferase family protein [Alkalicoccus daliensis]SDO13523.1 Thiamine kinase [Alkalicoccus daliensis]
MKQLEHFTGKDFIGDGWHLRPAGGATGEAYVAEQGKQKIFVKRNSSPFLAVLSAEGIVPKLLWTKRLENGDVITAQQWVNGRELKVQEMNNKRVSKLLAKIHQSEELLDMFKRMGNKPLIPQNIYRALETHVKHKQLAEDAVDKALTLLEKEFPGLTESSFVVCHADVHHNNWIEDERRNLFLIDWDGAQVADPALDLAPLLYEYVPGEDWGSWIEAYGAVLTNELKYRLWWYRTIQCIENVLWFRDREDPEAERWLAALEELIRYK